MRDLARALRSAITRANKVAMGANAPGNVAPEGDTMGILGLATMMVLAAACGGDGDGDGRGIDAAGGADAPRAADAADHTEKCEAFCGILARCNAEAPSEWDSCSSMREAECLAASAACAAAIAAFNTCAQPQACSDIPGRCGSQMSAVTSACGW